MALKPDRDEARQDIYAYMNEAAERGGIASFLTLGSGGAWKTVMGDTHNVVTYAANPSGKSPAGVLMNDMVPLVTRIGYTFSYGQRDEMPIGAKCCLLRYGWVVTNKISGTPVGGETAYVGPSGLFSPTAAAGAAAVGQFMGTLDEDGYAKVFVRL
jgi:hypothetical protein